MSLKRLIPLTLMLVLLSASSAWGSVLLKLELKELTLRSDLIVVGRVVEIRHEVVSRIHYTYTTVEVEQTLRGSIEPNANVTVRQRGGVVGDFEYRVHGDARLARDDRYVLFLFGGDLGVYFLRGMSQGAFTIERKPSAEYVRSQSAGFQQVDPPSIPGSASKQRRASRVAQPQRVTAPTRLDVLLEQIHTILREGGAR